MLHVLITRAAAYCHAFFLLMLRYAICCRFDDYALRRYYATRHYMAAAITAAQRYYMMPLFRCHCCVTPSLVIDVAADVMRAEHMRRHLLRRRR